jgi:hypothetical protein
MIEEQIATALEGVCSGGAWPDTAPPRTARPYCIYQQVGGESVLTLCGNARHNMRLQVWVWSATRAEASAKMRAAAAALGTALGALPIGELVARYDDTVALYGAQQDFSIWHHE